ncbi:hypothetical protein KAR91_26220 [Candidatus Pacearchaeota archaeon]|nr:hypothetical protein [Candidatus Pacearchaeota archaeon]
MIKSCYKCGREKPLTEFYKCRTRKDGYQPLCKQCQNDYIRIYQRTEKGREATRKANSKYLGTEKGKRVRANYLKTEARKNSRIASNAVNNAVRDGRLKKLPCSVCGKAKGVEGHHEDYSKPLEVNWLCMKHHNKLHRQRKGA